MNKMRTQHFKTIFKPCRPLIPLFLLGVLCLFAACSRDELFNRKTIATVNGEKIYLDEYERRLKAQKGLTTARGLQNSASKRQVLEEEILDSMITERIVLQRAKALKLSVSNTELDKKLQDIRADYGEDFFNLLAKQNVQYDEWREELKKEMLFDKLIAADVNASVRVSEDEAEDFFNEHPDQCRTEERVRASQIFVRDPEKAADIKARLDSGEDFTQVASEVSIGPEKVRGGDLGYISRQTMPDPLDKSLFSLPAGKISPIVKSAYGYHIFKVTEIQPARKRSFQECKKDIMDALRARKEDAAFGVWLDGLKMKAVVKKEIHLLKEKSQK